MGFLKAIGRFIRSLFGDKTRQQIGNLVQLALPVVERIAEFTPNRTDDEIVAAYKRYHKDGLLNAAKPVDVLLRDLAVAVVRDAAGMTYPSRMLILAVELAYNAYRERVAPTISPTSPTTSPTLPELPASGSGGGVDAF